MDKERKKKEKEVEKDEESNELGEEERGGFPKDLNFNKFLGCGG